MAVTTTPRLGLTRWSAGTDPVRRTQLDTSMANLELWAGRFEEGTLAARPAAGVRDRYYMTTDAGARVLYRDTGTTWETVGAVVAGGAVDKLASGQTANLREGRAAGNPGTLLYAIDSAGRGKFPNLTGTASRTTAPHLLVGKAADVSTGAGSADFSIGWDGTLEEDGVTLGSVAQIDHALITVAGVYRIIVNVVWGSGGGGNRNVYLAKSVDLGSANTYLAGNMRAAQGGRRNYQSISYEGRFAAGNIVWPLFQQDSGVSQTIHGASATNFSVEWVRP